MAIGSNADAWSACTSTERILPTPTATKQPQAFFAGVGYVVRVALDAQGDYKAFSTGGALRKRKESGACC